MFQRHVLGMHEVHFTGCRVIHRQHVAVTHSALTVKRHVTGTDNKHPALVVFHEHHLFAVLFLAVQFALIAPLANVLLSSLHNLVLSTLEHTLRLRQRIDIVGKGRKLFLRQSRIEQLHINLRIAHASLLHTFILLFQHVVAVHSSLQGILCLRKVTKHLSHSLIVRSLSAQTVLLHNVLTLSVRLLGMQRTRHKLLVFVSLSQSHTSILFFLATSKRLFVHCGLQLLCSHTVSLSYSFKSSLCCLLVLNLCSTIGIAQTLILTLQVQRVNDGVAFVNTLEAVLRKQFSILAVFVHRVAFNTAILHHRTLRRNSAHNQSRELSLCVPRNTIVSHYLVIGSLHKLSVCVLLALSFGCGLLGSHRPRCQTFLSRQRIVVYIISVERFFSLRRRRATEQLFLLLVGESITAESSSLSVRSHKAFNVSRHHIKVAFLYAVLFLTLR